MTATGADRARRAGQTARLVISVSSPFRLDYVVWALRRRAHNQVDRFDGGCYHRVLWLAERPGRSHRPPGSLREHAVADRQASLPRGVGWQRRRG